MTVVPGSNFFRTVSGTVSGPLIATRFVGTAAALNDLFTRSDSVRYDTTGGLSLLVRLVGAIESAGSISLSPMSVSSGAVPSVSGPATLTFTVPQTDRVKAQKALEPVLAAMGGGQVAIHEQIAKLSVVGVGMKTHSGVAATLFQALAAANINIEMISTSEIKISVIVEQERADEAARVAHAAFQLDQL